MWLGLYSMILKAFLQTKLFYNSNEKTRDLYSYISYVSGLDPQSCYDRPNLWVILTLVHSCFQSKRQIHIKARKKFLSALVEVVSSPSLVQNISEKHYSEKRKSPCLYQTVQSKKKIIESDMYLFVNSNRHF